MVHFMVRKGASGPEIVDFGGPRMRPVFGPFGLCLLVYVFCFGLFFVSVVAKGRVGECLYGIRTSSKPHALQT